MCVREGVEGGLGGCGGRVRKGGEGVEGGYKEGRVVLEEGRERRENSGFCFYNDHSCCGEL